MALQCLQTHLIEVVDQALVEVEDLFLGKLLHFQAPILVTLAALFLICTFFVAAFLLFPETEPDSIGVKVEDPQPRHLRIGPPIIFHLDLDPLVIPEFLLGLALLLISVLAEPPLTGLTIFPLHHVFLEHQVTAYFILFHLLT